VRTLKSIMTNLTLKVHSFFMTKDNVYYFANCIQSSDFNNKDFANSRLDITYLILDELKITKK